MDNEQNLAQKRVETRSPLAKCRSSIRVRYADTDQMRVVYHAKFFEYFEIGRSDLIRSLGVPYSRLEEQNVYLPVVEAYAHYRRPAHYDELVLVESSIYELPKATLKIEYNIFNESESEKLVEGWTVHSFFNPVSGKPMRAPKFFLALFSSNSNS